MLSLEGVVCSLNRPVMTITKTIVALYSGQAYHHKYNLFCVIILTTTNRKLSNSPASYCSPWFCWRSRSCSCRTRPLRPLVLTTNMTGPYSVSRTQDMIQEDTVRCERLAIYLNIYFILDMFLLRTYNIDFW